MTERQRLPSNWRSLPVRVLIRWLRDNGGTPPNVGDFRRHDLLRWIERYEPSSGYGEGYVDGYTAGHTTARTEEQP